MKDKKDGKGLLIMGIIFLFTPLAFIGIIMIIVLICKNPELMKNNINTKDDNVNSSEILGDDILQKKAYDYTETQKDDISQKKLYVDDFVDKQGPIKYYK